MPHAVSTDGFYVTWNHSLAEDFKQNGAPAVPGSWVADAARIGEETTPVSATALSHDNALIAAGVGSEVHVYDAATAERLHTFRGHTCKIQRLEFHPTLRKLASSSAPNDKLVRVCDLAIPDRDPAGIETVARTASAAADPMLLRHWSPEDFESAGLQKEMADILFAAQTKVDLRNSRAFSGDLPGCGSRAFSHGGHSLLYIRDRKDIAVLDVATLAERLCLSGHTDAVMWAETSPDDKLVLGIRPYASGAWIPGKRSTFRRAPEARAGAARGRPTARSSQSVQVTGWCASGMPTRETCSTPYRASPIAGCAVYRSRPAANISRPVQVGVLCVSSTLHPARSCSAQIDVTKHRSAEILLEVSCVRYTPRGDLFFTSTDGRIFGYRAAQNLKWDFFDPQSRYCGGPTSSVDGSRLIAGLGTSVGVWKIGDVL